MRRTSMVIGTQDDMACDDNDVLGFGFRISGFGFRVSSFGPDDVCECGDCGLSCEAPCFLSHERACVLPPSRQSTGRKTGKVGTKDKVRTEMTYPMVFPDEAEIDPYDPQARTARTHRHADMRAHKGARWRG